MYETVKQYNRPSLKDVVGCLELACLVPSLHRLGMELSPAVSNAATSVDNQATEGNPNNTM